MTFTSTSSDPDGSIAQIRWDTDGDNNFNDDGSDIEAERTFTTAGDKTVRLRVTDDDDNTVTITQVVQIANRAPTAVIDAPTAALKNTNITFKSDARRILDRPRRLDHEARVGHGQRRLRRRHGHPDHEVLREPPGRRRSACG